MLKVPYGQDPYSVIGKYIRDHVTAIEDIIAVIEIDDITINQLFMVDMNEENYFIWDKDWYEGEKDVALIDFFPVSEAINPSAQPEPQWIPVSERLPEAEYPVIVTWMNNDPASYYQYILGKHYTGVAHYKNGKWYWYSSVTEDALMEYGKCDSEEFDEAIEVIAWMPLPEPYSERRTDE